MHTKSIQGNAMFEPKPYTTQRSLADFLRRAFSGSWKGDELPVPGSRRRWDMAYLHEGQLVAVEYDGDEHYRHSLKIKADQEKDAAAQANDIRVVRFPYWIQLDTDTALYYFGIRQAVSTAFPHGFITTRHFPASFCELGLERFNRELSQPPVSVRTAVVRSLRDRAEEHGARFVVPSSLMHLVAA